MTKRGKLLLENYESKTGFWEYRNGSPECERTPSYRQENQSADDTWIMWLWILGTIGFLALLAKTTFWDTM